MLFWVTGLVLAQLIGNAHALNQFANVKVLKHFADSVLSPVQVVENRGRGIFADNVNGSIDILTTVSGRELATDYIFGPFANAAASPETPSPFGRPVSYNVTGLTIQHSTVTASITFDLQYDLLDLTVPIQVDGWFIIDDAHQIAQFDLSIKRWSWAVDTLLPQLTPMMAKLLGMPASTDSTQTLRQYLTAAICVAGPQSCQGPEQQYGNVTACMSEMSSKALGDWDRVGDDTLICRALSSQLAGYDAALHCPNMGSGGGSLCVSRSYADEAESVLPKSWNAAKYVTPENKHLVEHLQFASGESLNKIGLSDNEKHSWDPSLYATATFGYFLFLYFFAKALWFVFEKLNSTFRGISYELQKNVVMYAMNIIFTFVALVLELLATPVFAGVYELWYIKTLRASAVTISSLYIFELVFRFDMRLPLTIHHVLTIVAVTYSVMMFEYTQNPEFAVSGIVWLFQATTEQPTFLGLMGYRLKWDKNVVAKILKFSSVQTFVIKSASAVGLIVFWATSQKNTDRPMDIAWSALVFILAVGLLLTQIWGSYVTYIIGVRIARKADLPDTTEAGQRARANSNESKTSFSLDRNAIASTSSSMQHLNAIELGNVQPLRYAREEKDWTVQQRH